MALAVENLLIPSRRRFARPVAPETKPELKVSVVYTSVEATLGALKRASALAARLGAQISLVVPQIVPHPLPLDQPPVRNDWNESHFRTIASKIPVRTDVHIYLCRDPRKTLPSILKSNSLVIVGGKSRWWWPTAEQRLAAALQKAGHDVIFTETE